MEEAFALLELENNWEVWREIAQWLEDNDGKTEKDMGERTNQPKYTTKGDPADGRKSSILVDGWQLAGHERFAQLHAMVVADRDSSSGKQFEQDFKQRQFQKELEFGRTPQSSRKRKAAEVEVASTNINLLGDLLAAVTPSPV